MIWHRFFLKPLLSMFFFCLSAVLFLYILIDLSIHGVNFSKEWSGFSSLLFYYLKHLSIHWDLFATISFLLASLKVISDTTTHLEWSALQIGGLSSKKLLSPFFLFGLLLACLSLANGQWMAPSAGKIAHGLFESKKKAASFHGLLLDDGSELIYARQQDDLLHDLFWIRSPHEIWHLETFSPATQLGTQIDFLEIRDGIHSKSFSDHLVCAQIQLPCDWKTREEVPLESRSISALFLEPTAEGQTRFHRKLAEPFLPLLALLGIAPPLLHFKRRPRLFLITALSLLGFFIQFTIFEGLQILGENRVFPPSIAIWAPLILTAIFFLVRFQKIH